MITTNNGSFPWRATPLGEAMARALEGAPPDGVSGVARDLRDQLTRQLIEQQAKAGCELVSDGLVRREDPAGHVLGGIEGVVVGEWRDGYPGRGGRYRVPTIQGEVAWKAPILVEDYLFAATGAGVDVKVVLAGPYTLASLAEDRAYGDRMALAMALATALNRELRALQSAGVPLVQVDEPALLLHRDEFPVFTRVWEVLGRGIQCPLALNAEGEALGPLLPGMARLKRLGCLHLDAIHFPEDVAGIGAARLPDSLKLCLGVVSGADDTVESPEAIAAQVRSIAGLPPHEQILLGNAFDLGALSPATAAAKIAALAGAKRLLTAS